MTALRTLFAAVVVATIADAGPLLGRLPLLRGGLFRDTRWGWVKLLRPMLLGEVELGPGGLVVADPWSLHRTDALPAPAGRHAVFALTGAQE